MEHFKINPAGRYVPLNRTALSEGSRFFENRGRTLKYLRELDPDRMLYNFRAAFGIDTLGAEPLGGWEAPDGLLRGHSTGHFISALSLAYAATMEEVYGDKLRYVVHELRKLQLMSKGDPAAFETACTPEDAAQEKWSRDPGCWGEGFISAYSPDQFALLEKFTKYREIWAPYYTLHKIAAGLLECHKRVGLEEALDVAKGIGGWIYRRLSPLSAEHRRKMWSLYIAGEFGGMNESMSRLYDITGDERFLETAKMFDNDNIFPGLAEGRDTIANLHANQHIPQLIGAHREYMATGDEFYENAAKNFFDIVTGRHMYAIGGVGQGESFRDAYALAANIKDDTNCETCAAYNLLKLAKELYAFDPDNSVYMEYYERALVNQILASQSPVQTPERTGGVTYMLPIGPGAERQYSDNYNSFTCCHGTGMENHVKYQDASFFMTDGALYINQYIGASMESAPLSVSIRGGFPFGEAEIRLVFRRDFTVRLRVPRWCERPFPGLEMEGSYAVLRGKVGEEKSVKGRFDYSPRLEFTPDRLDGSAVAALLYGPFVMVVRNPSKEWLTLSGDILDRLRPLSEEDVPALTDGEHTFVPMYTADSGPYHAYFKISED